jgi:hypothetical protein
MYMSGCKSCSGHAPEPVSRTLGKAEKLEKSERSGNPRYPHVLVGQQAIYSDGEVQMIVKVVADESDESCDSFTLKPQRVLKNSKEELSMPETFQVSQPAGESCWRLHALL